MPFRGNKMIKRIWAFITGQKLVWLKDFDGTITLSINQKDGFGSYAKRHWPYNIKNVRLLPGGKIGNGSYVTAWKQA